MNKVLFNLKNNAILSVLFCCYAMCCSFSTSLYANVEVISYGKKVIVDLTHMNGDQANCRLVDDQGRVVYSSEISSLDKKVKNYDLSSLQKGDYTMIIEDEMSIDKIFLELSNAEIVSIEKSKPIYKPTIVREPGDRIHLNLLSRNKEVELSVTKKGEEFFSKTYVDEPSINEIIDFSRADKGDYVIQVSILGEVFYRNVSI